MAINIAANKERYLDLLAKAVGDDYIFLEIKDWLEEGDFFEAPASTKFHLHVEGGLCQHSLNVRDQLFKLCEVFNVSVSDISKNIVALTHDWCKIDVYEKSSRRVPPERTASGKWETEDIFIKNDAYHLGHASKSIYLVQRFLVLTMEEIEAIAGHMGSTDLSTMFNSFDLNSLFTQNPLAVCLHLADMSASYLIEDDLGNK